MYITHGQLVNEQIRAEGTMSELDFFGAEIAEWKNSPARVDALTGDRYYKGDHDILTRKRTITDGFGNTKELKRLPNNRIVDNLYGKMVDQKKNYLLGKPITFDTKNSEYSRQLNKVFNRAMLRLLKFACQQQINGGIAWLYPYISEGEFCLRVFPAYEILPFWEDEAHTKLECACRLYRVEYYSNSRTKEYIELVDIFKKEGITTYRLEGSNLTLEKELIPYLKDNAGKAYNWTKLPLIPVKCNPKEIPLIKKVKTIQDDINLTLSDFANISDQNPYNTPLVIKNYDGTSADDFWSNFAAAGFIKVRSEDGLDGGVEPINIDVGVDKFKAKLDIFKRELLENARGFDAKDERMNANPNQMNIQSMYSDIDLDAEDMESEWQAAFEELLWFVNSYFEVQGIGDFSYEEVNIIFNRDILINESEAIDNVAKSAGMISQRTMVAQHPWIKDVNAELENIKNEQESMNSDYEGAFPLIEQAGVDNAEET